MRHSITLLSIAGSLYILGLVTNVYDTTLMFLLFGIVPNSLHQLSAAMMLGIYEIAAAVVTVIVLRKPLRSSISLLRHKLPQAIESFQTTHRRQA